MTTVHMRVAAISPPRSPFGKMSNRLRRCQIITASGLLGINHLDLVTQFTRADVTPVKSGFRNVEGSHGVQTKSRTKSKTDGRHPNASASVNSYCIAVALGSVLLFSYAHFRLTTPCARSKDRGNPGVNFLAQSWWLSVWESEHEARR
jgi:hypothetical protein